MNHSIIRPVRQQNSIRNPSAFGNYESQLHRNWVLWWIEDGITSQQATKDGPIGSERWHAWPDKIKQPDSKAWAHLWCWEQLGSCHWDWPTHSEIIANEMRGHLVFFSRESDADIQCAAEVLFEVLEQKPACGSVLVFAEGGTSSPCSISSWKFTAGPAISSPPGVPVPCHLSGETFQAKTSTCVGFWLHLVGQF